RPRAAVRTDCPCRDTPQNSSSDQADARLAIAARGGQGSPRPHQSVTRQGRRLKLRLPLIRLGARLPFEIVVPVRPTAAQPLQHAAADVKRKEQYAPALVLPHMRMLVTAATLERPG